MCLWCELVISSTGCRLSRKPVAWDDVIFLRASEIGIIMQCWRQSAWARFTLFFLCKGACTWQPAGGEQVIIWQIQQIYSGTLTVCLCVILKVHTVIISTQKSQGNGIRSRKAFDFQSVHTVHTDNYSLLKPSVVSTQWFSAWCDCEPLKSDRWAFFFFKLCLTKKEAFIYVCVYFKFKFGRFQPIQVVTMWL